MQIQALREWAGRLQSKQPSHQGEASVLIALTEDADNLSIVLEVRALTLAVQPGEVCLPGGRIEADESPEQAAVRETCEELCIDPHDIEVIASLGPQPGPGGKPLHVLVGLLHNYAGTFSPDEVDRTFLLSLDWLLTHDPEVYRVMLTPTYPNDFPWEKVPGGRMYPWRAQRTDVPFYPDTDPVVWGATARVLMRFAALVKESGAVQ